MARKVDINTTIWDGTSVPLQVGMKVALFNMVGEVVFTCGAYGIKFSDSINWDFLESKILEITGCNNTPYFCHNDNFISFWELMWNFNCEDDTCDVVEMIGLSDR